MGLLIFIFLKFFILLRAKKPARYDQRDNDENNGEDQSPVIENPDHSVSPC
jgi:hypothetical protein